AAAGGAEERAHVGEGQAVAVARVAALARARRRHPHTRGRRLAGARVRGAVAAAHGVEEVGRARCGAPVARARVAAVSGRGRTVGARAALLVREARAGQARVRAAVTVGVVRHRARLADDQRAHALAVVRLLGLGGTPLAVVAVGDAVAAAHREVELDAEPGHRYASALEVGRLARAGRELAELALGTGDTRDRPAALGARSRRGDA